MIDLDSLSTPTLLLDVERAQRNLAAMAAHARRLGVRFRPHFKTHQSVAIGVWFRTAGVTAITVSSVRMGHYFAEAGWQDILVAFPLNVRELTAVEQLAARTRLGVLVDSRVAVDALSARLASPVDVWVEVDAGYRRSGVEATDRERVLEVGRAVRNNPRLRLRGVLTHAGNSYGVRDLERLHVLHEATIAALVEVRNILAAEGWDGLEISVGDTPIASRLDDLGPVDEIRPGNFLFFDWMQHAAGVCAEDAIAVAAACPIVAHYPRRNEVVIYGGAVHLSKEFIRGHNGEPDYGHVAPLSDRRWGPAFPGVWLRSLSQEHGVVTATAEAYARFLAPLAVGDLVAVLPIHSCLTADLCKRYLTLDGETIPMMGV